MEFIYIYIKKKETKKKKKPFHLKYTYSCEIASFNLGTWILLSNQLLLLIIPVDVCVSEVPLFVNEIVDNFPETIDQHPSLLV